MGRYGAGWGAGVDDDDIDVAPGFEEVGEGEGYG